MTEAAVRAGAVNLAQGFPSFDGPDVIKLAAKQAIDEGRNQYAPAAGLLELRKALAEKEKREHNLSYDPALEVTVTSGATEALFCAIMATCPPESEIICFAPFYDSYPAAAFAAGARLVEVTATAPDWNYSVDDIRKKISGKTSAILINTPQNPSGKVFSKAELQALAELACEHDLWVITDEVYEHILFDNLQVTRIAGLAGMRERTITISSFSKSFSVTGWKIGYCFAPEAIMTLIRNIHQFTVFCSATPLQWGALAALQMPTSYYSDLVDFYAERRDLLLKGLQAAGFKSIRPQGTYFILADYRAIRDVDDVEFALWLTREHRVACIPTSVFYQNPPAVAAKQRLVRFAFCKDLEILQQAAMNLKNLF